METEIDSLIDAAATHTESGVSRGQPRSDLASVAAKTVPPEPDEPELIGETRKVIASGLKRRLLQREQARERRLRFARALVSSGFDGEKALLEAGYSVRGGVKYLQDAVGIMKNHPDVISEVERLRLILEQRADIMTIDLAKEWVGIASSDIFDYFDETLGEDGETIKLTLKPKTEITKAARRSVKAIKIRRNKRTTKEGEQIETEDIEVQLWDKHSALDSLAKIQGLYQDKQADAINNLASKIADRTEKARRRIGRTFDSGALEAPKG